MGRPRQLCLQATFILTQSRNATLLRRPRRPYTFTQLIALSDGSTFLHRTTSPVPVYRSTRDTRNAPEWNPSSARLSNTENDEAGQLAAFRSRFGGAWDASSSAAGGSAGPAAPATDAAATAAATATATATATEATLQAEAAEADPYAYAYDSESDDSLLDLITGFGQDEAAADATKKQKK
ncbi:hypothetical protein KEM52_001003 [Ascosphaera acerosa]|nr:hypothetical protein KEM52_001003 [Ascosphaera acerosa]